MTVPAVPLVLVLVFAGVALAVSAASLAFALSARAQAREAHDAVRQLASAAAKRRREQREAAEQVRIADLDDRDVNLGPPPSTAERRERNLGPAARVEPGGRHRDPIADRARRRDADDPQYGSRQPEPADDVTREVPAVRPEELETAEHAAPTSTYRRPPPVLPRPGSIGRQ